MKKKCFCGLPKGHKGPHLRKEDAPTNSMGAGGSGAAIQTFDPLLFANIKKRHDLRRFSSFLKNPQLKKN